MDVDKYRARPDKGPACTTGLALKTLPDDKATFLQQLLDDPLVSKRKIAEYSVEDFGLRLPISGLARHARGECKCA